jgi:hypothetical protein
MAASANLVPCAVRTPEAGGGQAAECALNTQTSSQCAYGRGVTVQKRRS